MPEKLKYKEDLDRLGWGDQRRGKVDLSKKKEGEGDFKALGGTDKAEIDSMYLIREQYQGERGRGRVILAVRGEFGGDTAVGQRTNDANSPLFGANSTLFSLGKVWTWVS